MEKKIIKQDIVRIANQYGIDVHIANAIMQVENSGRRFDPHWFKKLAKHSII